MVCNSLGAVRSFLAIASMMALAGTGVLGQDKPAAAPASKPPVQETDSGKSAESHHLKDLEQSIFKPFRTLEPEGSLDGVIERPQRPPVLNKRAKEMIERRKNWAFMTPEELINGKNTEDPLDPQNLGKNEDENKQLSPMERYFQRLYGEDKRKANDNKRDGKRDRLGSNSSDSTMDESDGHDDSIAGLPESVRETQRNVKKNGDTNGMRDLQPGRAGWGLFSDVFALERKKATPEEDRVERERLEAYRKSLGLDPTPTFGATFSPSVADPKDPYRISLPPSLMDSTPSSPSSGPASAGNVPLPHANPFIDSPSKSVAPSSLAPALPPVDPPKSSLPPQPTFAAPRRVF